MEKKQEYDSDKQILDARKQEMEGMLPGLVCKLVLPNSGKQVDVYSKKVKTFTSKEDC